MEKNHFNSRADENRRVQQNHPEKFWIGDFGAAVGDDLLLMVFGNFQLDDAEGRNGEKKREKRDNGYCH
jgi:hypothetical protein